MSVEDREPSASRPFEGRTFVFLVAEDWYFWSHRLPLARAARDAGAKVVVAARFAEHIEPIAAEGFLIAPIPFSRAGLNPLHDIKTIVAVLRLYRRVKPDLVHHVAMKPVVFGSLAARLASVVNVVNAIAGLGFLFTSEKRGTRLLRAGFLAALRIISRRPSTFTIVQNDDDRQVLEKNGLQPSRITTIRGSGVDTNRFTPAWREHSRNVAVCVSRMLWDKGIGELVQAAKLLRDRDANVRIRLVGSADLNPASIPQDVLDQWAREGLVDVAGHSNDIPSEYANADIAVLPSYREGLPKSLLEAAASGLPIVSTDVPGCRDICRHETTGLLVPPRDPLSIADALERLSRDRDLRDRLGKQAREVVEAEFSETIVVRHTMDLYRSLLGSNETRPVGV